MHEQSSWIEVPDDMLCYMNLQFKTILLERCQELEKTAKEQAADNAILDQLSKVLYTALQLTLQTSKSCDQLSTLSLSIPNFT